MKRRKQTALVKKQKRANRINRMLRFIWRIIFLAVLMCAALFAMTIFFRIDKITVEGVEKYTSEEIISGMDVKKGDNLYLFNKFKTADALLVKFPYLASVQIRRKLPDGLLVTVTECDALAAVPTDNGYFLVSGQGKILEQGADSKGLPIVTGASLMGSAPGEMIDPSKDAYADVLLTIIQTLDAADMLEDTDFINMQSLTDVRIGYMDRFDIRIGTVDSLAYRMRFARFVMGEKLSPSDVGRLYWDSKGRLHFVPDTIENVQKSGNITQNAQSSDAPEASGTPEDGEGKETVQDGEAPEDGLDGSDSGGVNDDDTNSGGEESGSDSDGSDIYDEGSDSDNDGFYENNEEDYE